MNDYSASEAKLDSKNSSSINDIKNCSDVGLIIKYLDENTKNKIIEDEKYPLVLKVNSSEDKLKKLLLKLEIVEEKISNEEIYKGEKLDTLQQLNLDIATKKGLLESYMQVFENIKKNILPVYKENYENKSVTAAMDESIGEVQKEVSLEIQNAQKMLNSIEGND
ncbi:MAG TPA: hypothetical protein QF753_20100 [Victivallales bacterium]|nr:hypothetical protein [Victivallales bacterium]